MTICPNPYIGALRQAICTDLAEQLVENVISEIAAEHKDDFHVVRLNGFIHTDDKIALKEIWRQLGKEMEVEDGLINKVCSPSKGCSVSIKHGFDPNVAPDKQLRRHARFASRCSVSSF